MYCVANLKRLSSSLLCSFCVSEATWDLLVCLWHCYEKQLSCYYKIFHSNVTSYTQFDCCHCFQPESIFRGGLGDNRSCNLLICVGRNFHFTESCPWMPLIFYSSHVKIKQTVSFIHACISSVITNAQCTSPMWLSICLHTVQYQRLFMQKEVVHNPLRLFCEDIATCYLEGGGYCCNT